jgi:hypothetical protein
MRSMKHNIFVKSASIQFTHGGAHIPCITSGCSSHYTDEKDLQETDVALSVADIRFTPRRHSADETTLAQFAMVKISTSPVEKLLK